MEEKPFRVAAVSDDFGSITTYETDTCVYIPLHTIVQIEADKTRFKKGYKHTTENISKLHKVYGEDCRCGFDDIEKMRECVNSKFLYKITTKKHRYLTLYLTGKSGERNRKKHKTESSE
jgi:hypothetical protein